MESNGQDTMVRAELTTGITGTTNHRRCRPRGHVPNGPIRQRLGAADNAAPSKICARLK
jgi:hypothetical protein